MILTVYSIGMTVIAAIGHLGWWDAQRQHKRLSDQYWKILTERFGNDEAITRLGQE